MAVSPDQTVLVVGLPEVDMAQAELFDGAEGPDLEQVLLQRSDGVIGAAVAFGQSHKGRGGCRSQLGQCDRFDDRPA